MSLELASLPRTLQDRLFEAATFIAPLLDTCVLGSDGRLDQRALSKFVCRCRPGEIHRRITVASAVYVAWDSRAQCQYVGSVCRQGPTAVGDRIAEHYHVRARPGSPSRRETWAILTVMPIRPDAAVEVVRSAEGWVARYLNPIEGQAHPQVEAHLPPARLAETLAVR